MTYKRGDWVIWKPAWVKTRGRLSVMLDDTHKDWNGGFLAVNASNGEMNITKLRELSPADPPLAPSIDWRPDYLTPEDHTV